MADPAPTQNPSFIAGVAPDAAAAIATPPVGQGALTYDPSNPQPYQPEQLPPVQANVPAAAALPQQQQVQDMGATNHAGGVAYMLDQGLRGFMQGRAVQQQQQAVKLAKQQQALTGLVNTTSERLYSMAQAGVDPNSKEFQDAQGQVQAAWQAQQNFIGQHIQGQTTDKKTGKTKPKQANLLQRMFQSDDPAAVPAAWYEASQKLGPPVLWQIKPFLTTQYKQKLATQQGTQANTEDAASIKASAQKEYDQLATSSKPLNDTQKARMAQLDEFIHSGTSEKLTPDGKPYEDPDNPGQYLQPFRYSNGKAVSLPMPEGWKPPAPPAPKVALGSLPALVESYAKYAREGGVPAGDLPPAVNIYLESIHSWAMQHPGVTTHSTTTIRKGIVDGQTKDIPVTVTNTSQKGVPPPPSPPPGWPAVSNLNELTGATSVPPSAHSENQSEEGTETKTPKVAIKKQEEVKAEAKAIPKPEKSNVQVGQALPYNVPDAAYNKAKTDVVAATKLSSLADQAVANPTGPNNMLLVNELVKATLSRTNQIEINSLLNSNGWVLRAGTWVSRAKNGTLPTPVLEKLRDFTRDNLRATMKALNAATGYEGTTPSGTPSDEDILNKIDKLP